MVGVAPTRLHNELHFSFLFIVPVTTQNLQKLAKPEKLVCASPDNQLERERQEYTGKISR
jgi:hypothetical protein